MDKREESSTEGDGQAQTVEPARAERAERPSEAAVNPAVALTLLGGEDEGEESSRREPRDKGAPPQP